jgi:hypothetical protein
MDIVFLALIGAFAALVCGMAAGCARLGEKP